MYLSAWTVDLVSEDGGGDKCCESDGKFEQHPKARRKIGKSIQLIYYLLGRQSALQRESIYRTLGIHDGENTPNPAKIEVGRRVR